MRKKELQKRTLQLQKITVVHLKQINHIKGGAYEREETKEKTCNNNNCQDLTVLWPSRYY